MSENEQGAGVFVGRKLELDQFEQAIKPDGNISGLFFGPGAGVRARVFLLHGVGGIGKSWLGRECLKRAHQKKWATLEVDCSLPGDRAGLMNLMAQALKERYGDKLTQDYERICERARKVREGIQRFQEEYPAKWQYFSDGASQTGPDLNPQPGSALAQDWALGISGAIIGVRAYIPTKAEDNFIGWLLQTGQIKPEDALLFHDPDSGIAAELGKTLKAASSREPLVLLLDGCQTLPYKVEEWLRDVIVCPLVKANPPMIFIISGRQNQTRERQVSLEDGTSITVKGYADRLSDPAPVNWPLERFCDPEISELLTRAGLPSEAFLVDFVQSRSGGIPLAVRMVIHALQKLGGDFVRDRYFMLDPSSYSYDEIVTHVTRVFLDTVIENPSLLLQVRGLALTRPLDETGFRAALALPDDVSTRQVLANLARCVSFIEPGGKMAPIVREFIRHELRIKDAFEARRLGKLAADALMPAWQQVCGGESALAERTALPAWRKCAQDVLNVLCWWNETDALQFLAARVLESVLFDAGFARQLVAAAEEFNNPPEWFSAAGQRLISSLRMAAFRETGLKNIYSFLLEQSVQLGLNNQHRAVLYILQAQDPIQPDAANNVLKNLLAAEGQLTSGSDLSLQQALANSFAEIGWQPGEQGIAQPGFVTVRSLLSDGEIHPGTGALPGGQDNLNEAGWALASGTATVESDAESLNNLANFYYGSNKFDQAVETYKRAIILDPLNARSWNGLGGVYSALNRIDDAIASYHKAIELDPAFVAPWNGLGALYNDIKNSEQAIAAYNKAIELDSSDATPWNGLGNVYHGIHNSDKAIEAYKQSIELDPRFAHPWNGLGYVYRHQNRLEEAIVAFNKAIELHPLFALPWNGLGFIYRSMNNNEQAMHAYKKAIEISPRFGIPWNGLGYIYREMGRLDEAIDAFNKAIDFDPNYAAAWNGLGIVYTALKRFEEALAAHYKATQFEPDKASYWNGLANTYREMGENINAIAAYQKAIEADPVYTRAWYGLGAVYGMLGQTDQAIGAFNRAIEIEPGWAYPWIGLGNVHHDAGNFDEATIAYNKAIELDPALAASLNGLSGIQS